MSRPSLSRHSSTSGAARRLDCATCWSPSAIGQFFFDSGSGRDRLEYTEYGAGDALGRAAPRPADAAPDAPATGPGAGRRGAARGDPRPARPRALGPAGGPARLLDDVRSPTRWWRCSTTSVPTQAVIGGTSLGANVSLEVAATRAGAGQGADRRDAGAGQRARRRDRGVRAADVRGPVPAVHVSTVCGCSPGPSRAGWCRSGPASRSTPSTSGPTRWPRSSTASSSAGWRRPRSSAAAITAPALVVGHPADPIHPFADAAMLAGEMPNAQFVEAHSVLEWRARPERLDRDRGRLRARLLGDAPRARRRTPRARA